MYHRPSPSPSPLDNHVFSVPSSPSAPRSPSVQSLSNSYDNCGSSNNMVMSSSSARGSTTSIDSMLVDLGREHDLRTKYPEFHRVFNQVRNTPRGLACDMDTMMASIPPTPEGRLFREAVEMYTEAKKLQRQLTKKDNELDSLEEQHRHLRLQQGRFYLRAEQEEELIANRLLAKIHKLKNDKEVLSRKFLTAETSISAEVHSRMQTLQQERDKAQQMEAHPAVDDLLRKVDKLQAEIASQHRCMQALHREKADQEIALECEQEAIFNNLGKQLDALNEEKKRLLKMLQQANDQGFIYLEEGGDAPANSSVSESSSMAVSMSELRPAASPAGNDVLKMERDALKAERDALKHELELVKHSSLLKDKSISELRDANKKEADNFAKKSNIHRTFVKNVLVATAQLDRDMEECDMDITEAPSCASKTQ